MGRRRRRRGGWLVGCVVGLFGVLGVPVVAWGGVLPDGRVYEQVSPVLKDGYEAGALAGIGGVAGNVRFAVATGDGDGVLYGSSGPLGEANRGLQEYTVGRRGSSGWSAVSAVPPSALARPSVFGHEPVGMLPSSDLSSVFFNGGGYVAADNLDGGALVLGHADGSVEWVTRPQIPNSVPAPEDVPGALLQTVGGTPDLGTVYFWGLPTLLAQDVARAGNTNGWGLYEYSHGVLGPAGTLPDGSEDPGGAAPASTGSSNRGVVNLLSAEAVGNQVSRDGLTLWFVSPDPGAIPDQGPVTELYVRRGGRSVLVSRMANGSVAPSGVVGVRTLNGLLADPRGHQFAFGSADGGSAVFQSVDALTADAPSDGLVKSYRYVVASDTVSYLPGVDGATVVAASDDGRRFLFGNTTRIGLWDEGRITTLVAVSNSGNAAPQVAPARATSSGSVFVFSTAAPVAGLSAGGVVQVYRYDVARDDLACVSCLPAGGAGSGAVLANQFGRGMLLGARGMSGDGQRVFFQSSDALVSRDVNGQVDVYEWTPGGVSLISTGRSQRDSFLLDSSVSGDDVFFATAEGLDGEDRDGSYDVYDARVDGGFKQVAVTAPCVGDVCRSGVSGPAVVPPAGSSRFSGPGDQVPPVEGSAPSAKLRLGARRVVGGRLEVSVSFARPGRVSVSGVGLRAVSKSYAKAGSYRLVVGLSASAKRSLKRSHRLRLGVRVGFSPQSGPASSVRFVVAAKA